jgi:hypothetical protein
LKVTEAWRQPGDSCGEEGCLRAPCALGSEFGHICPLPPLDTHLLHGLLEAVQPVGQAAAVGPGACCGLSQGLWAEQGVVRGQAWDTGDTQVIRANPLYGWGFRNSHSSGAGSGCDAVCEAAGPGCPPVPGQSHSPGRSLSESAQPARPSGAPTPEHGDRQLRIPGERTHGG